MAKNQLFIREGEGLVNAHDRRWLVSNHGANESSNATFVVDDKAKEEGVHRIDQRLLSGVPVYIDESKKVHIFDQEAKNAGQKMYGVTHSGYDLAPASDKSNWYEEIPIAVFRHGSVYSDWLHLPEGVTAEDLPVNIFNTVL